MYIGIDVGGTNLVAGLVDETGSIVNKASRPVDKDWGDRELCRQIALLALQAAGGAPEDRESVKAVGAGLPGIVDNGSGTVVTTPNMPFRDTPFRQLFQQVWEVPVFLGNDANCAAVGEYWAGAAKDCDPAVVVTLGTGIGGGMVSGGRLYTGWAGSGMEVGHMVVHPGGIMCGCGSRGCWERYGSATALIQLTREEMERSRNSLLWTLCRGDMNQVEGRTAFQGAGQGDEAAKRVLERYLQGLSLGLISLCNILNPQVICLGGGISSAEDALLLDPLRQLVYAGCFDKRNLPRLTRAALGNDAGVVGAAMLCHMV